MRNILLLIAIAFYQLNAFAQFKLTIDGFVDENDPTKDYIVYTFQDKDQDRLYTDVLKFINDKYKSPKDVINEVKNEMIVISGFQESCISLTKVKKVLGQRMSITGGFDMQYNITIRIKDSRIRVDAPTFECTQDNKGKITRLVMTGSNGGFGSEVRTGLFKKDGTPSREVAISMIEDFFNGFCEEMEKEIKDTSKDDW